MPRSRVAPVALLCLSVGVAGCATGRGADAPPDLPAAADVALDLSRRAAKERARPPETLPPVPPGVEPDALARRDPADTRARRSLDDVLATLADGLAIPAAPPAEAEPDEAARTAALRHYVRGREAAVRNEYYLAILELEKALALDPSSPSILREIARASQGLGNMPRAAAFYERLLAVDPDDPEALFAIGLAALDRRDFETAAAAIARPRLAGRSFRHDAAAPMLADFILFRAVEALGCDRAAIEAGRAVAMAPIRPLSRSVLAMELASAYRQRGAIWRSIGDAHCRLGEYDEALEAYNASLDLQTSDPSAMPPRIIYAHLAQGRPFHAQEALYVALRDEAPAISDQGVRLCSYVAQHASDVVPLVRAVDEIYRAHPDEASCARAAAALRPPDEATRVLREFINRRPRDLAAAGELMAWVARRDVNAAASMTIALSADQPDLDASYTERLILAAPRVAPMLAAVASQPPAPAQAVVHGRLLISLGALGEAWDLALDARTRWPDDRRLLLLQVDLAILLDEPRLLDEVIDAAAQFDHLDTWLGRARAERARGRTEAAVDAAARAVAHDEQDIEAHLELARAFIAHAEATRDEGARQRRAEQAATAAERAVTLDPRRDDAYDVLLSLYRTGGLLENVDQLRQVAARLRAAAPDSRLYARLSAEEAISRQREDEAVERLLRLYEDDPADTAALGLAISAWSRAGRLEAAERWLDEQLERRPDDPALLGQWVRVLVLQNRADEIVAALRDRLARDPDDHTALFLLETTYRATGRPEEASELGERRLLARPRELRRELELAALYVGTGREDEAMERLRWIRAHHAAATREILLGAMGVANQLQAAGPERDLLVIELAERAAALRPDVPLAVYANAIRALARLGRFDEQFDTLLTRAATSAEGADDLSPDGVAPWRELAQTLVDDGEPAAAARALRTRFDAQPDLEPGAVVLLVRMLIAAEAAADDPEATQDLMRELHRRSALRIVLGGQGPPTLADALYETSSIYSILGRHEGADRLLVETLRLDPDRAMAMNNLGYTRIEAGRADEQTIAWIEQAFALQPDDANILDTLGWLRYRQGRFEGDEAAPGALELIERSIAVSPDPSAEVLDHLGDTLWRLDQRERAEQAWRAAALKLEDEREIIRQNLRLIQLREWRLLVADPDVLYHQQFGELLERVRQKLQRAEQGTDPRIAATFAEGREPGGP